MKNSEQIELLAPAKNYEYGKEAINHGADAVYIGAPNFGARSAVANSITDIETLVKYAHLYKAKVYATLNTILFDDELSEAEKIINDLYHVGIDGLIIQDLGILEMNLPPVPIIASTQTHNASVEKVLFLEKVGFKRVILARELSLEEIRAIKEKTTVELESFVHGALCVSYSGQCYLSQAVCNRSGNRGVCAQPCRSTYDLVDQKGNTIVSNKHLLSLKDLNLSSQLGKLIEAGISSFKIEGRLKDLGYVKNVISFYRKELDRVLERMPVYKKSSSGTSLIDFTPDLAKSFNRGFTSYFIEGRKEKTGSFVTQKSLGKRIGKVIQLDSNWFKADGEELSNGDGICFFDSQGNLTGTLINKVENGKVYPKEMMGLLKETELFRNHDHEFEKILKRETSKRKIEIIIGFREWERGYLLQFTDEDGFEIEARVECAKIPADKIDVANKQIINQLSKLGDTCFIAKDITVNTSVSYFIPLSILNQLRRDAVKKLEETRLNKYSIEHIQFTPNDVPYPQKQISYLGNVSNHLARQFYSRHGVESIEPAYEMQTDHKNKVVMTTRHCIRYQLNACKVHQNAERDLPAPLYLKDHHNKFRLEFDCKNCVMKVIYEE